MTADINFWKSVEPEDLFRAVADKENVNHVMQVMKTLSYDPIWTKRVIESVESGRIETRCFISWLAREMQPRSYLEVGVRRGFAMATVASQVPEVEIYGFDLWLPNYAAVDNPGPKFIQSEMERVGYRKRVHFISGNTHRTLPAFFDSKRARLWDKLVLNRRLKSRATTFNMILIDGDHSLVGAYQDLSDTMPYCEIGGVVVFDDIAPDYSKLDPEAVKAERGKDPYGWGDLLGVWRAVQEKFRNFRYFEYVKNPPGVGLAVRLS